MRPPLGHSEESRTYNAKRHAARENVALPSFTELVVNIKPACESDSWEKRHVPAPFPSENGLIQHTCVGALRA